MVVRRILWLALALILAVVVPFIAFSQPTIGMPAAILMSLAGLVAAGFAVRASAGRRD